METSRRGFLGIVGGAILGSVPIAGALASRGGTGPDSGALKGKKWAMVIDVRKCTEKCMA